MHEQPCPSSFNQLKVEIDRGKEKYNKGRDHDWFNGGTYTMPDGSVYLVIALVPIELLKRRLYGDSADRATQFNESQWHNAFKAEIAQMGGVFGVDSGIATGIVKASDDQTIDWLYTQMQSALSYLTQTQF